MMFLSKMGRWSSGLMHWISPLGTLTLVTRQMSLIASSKYSMDIRLHPQNRHAIWQEQQSVLTRRLEVLGALAVLWEEASDCAVPGVSQRSHPLASPSTSNTRLPRIAAKQTWNSSWKKRGKDAYLGSQSELMREIGWTTYCIGFDALLELWKLSGFQGKDFFQAQDQSKS